MRLLVLPALFALAACGATQSPECVAYLECQAAVDAQVGSSTVGTLEPLYGPKGTCWTDPASAASCDAACTSGLEAARGSVDPVPAECAE